MDISDFDPSPAPSRSPTDAGPPPVTASVAIGERPSLDPADTRLARAVGGSLPGLGFGLAAVLVAFAGINALRFPPPLSGRIVVLNLAVALLLGAAGWVARRGRIPIRWLEPTTGALVALAAGNVYQVALWAGDPLHVALAVPAPVVAAVGLYSWRPLAATAAVLGAGWALIAAALGTPPQLSFALLGSMVLAAIVLQLRRQAVARIERLVDRLKEGDARLRVQERLTRLFVRHSPVSVLMVDRDVRILAVSERWMSDFLPGGEDPRGRIFYELFPTTPDRWKEMHQRCLAGGVERCDEDPIVLPDGARQWLRWEVRPWYEEGGTIGGLVCFSEYVTERKRMRDALERLARYDPLTGVLNRGAITDELERRWRRFASAGEPPFAVLFLDLDAFKAINDSDGHAAGDRILIETGARLRSSLRPTDAVGRFGGDEFVVLLHDVASVDLAQSIAVKLQERLGSAIDVGEGSRAVEVSVGVALVTEAATLDSLLDLADARMYAAKRRRPRGAESLRAVGG